MHNADPQPTTCMPYSCQHVPLTFLFGTKYMSPTRADIQHIDATTMQSVSRKCQMLLQEPQNVDAAIRPDCMDFWEW
jgi:hypothetical protein